MKRSVNSKGNRWGGASQEAKNLIATFRWLGYTDAQIVEELRKWQAEQDAKQTAQRRGRGKSALGEMAQKRAMNMSPTAVHDNAAADAAFIAAARAAVPALLAELERLTRRNNELAEQLRLANEREAAARVECGRLNGQAAGKVKELLAEVERLRADNAQLQQQRHAAREDAYRLGVEEGLSLSRGISNERDALRAELALRDRYNEYVRVTQALRTSEVLPFDEWNRGDVPPLRPDAPRLRRPTKD